jgi:endoglucanase
VDGSGGAMGPRRYHASAIHGSRADHAVRRAFRGEHVWRGLCTHERMDRHWLVVFLAALIAACAPAGERVASSSESVSETPALDGATELPLVTRGRFIVDQRGARVKLVSANWYGAESPDLVPGGLDRQDAKAMAETIKGLGFNSVRLPWSNELLRLYREQPDYRLPPRPETEPAPEDGLVVHRDLVAANEGFADLHPFEIFDRVVDAVTSAGLFVILDNHTSRADWCCDDWDGNGLWYRDDADAKNRYSEEDWLEDWRYMAKRYAQNPRVIGAELRNELRSAGGVKPVWGGGDRKRDWKAAAERGGEAVLAHAPHWLVFVDGLEWSTDLSGVYRDPVSLSVANRVVYAPHDYAWFHPQLRIFGYEGNPLAMKDDLGRRWGFILRQNETYTAPVWVSEIGTCADDASCFTSTGGGSQGDWFEGIKRYLSDADIDWAYWAINPTQSSQQPDSYRKASNKRRRGAVESYGLLSEAWSAPEGAKRALVDSLMQLRDAKEGP